MVAQFAGHAVVWYTFEVCESTFPQFLRLKDPGRRPEMESWTCTIFRHEKTTPNWTLTYLNNGFTDSFLPEQVSKRSTCLSQFKDIIQTELQDDSGYDLIWQGREVEHLDLSQTT